MKKLIPLFILTFSNIYAAFPNDPANALLLHSGTVYPSDNIHEFISEKISQSEIIDGYYYRIIQFENFPGETEKAKILASGILLNMYIPYHAYNCAIPVNFDRNKLTDLHAHAVLNWNEKIKLHRELTGSSLPPHIIIEKGYADLVVLYQQNIPSARARQLFESSGFRVLSFIDAIHSATVRIPIEKLKELSDLPFVYFIEPIAVPPKKDDTEGRSLHRSNFINSDFFTGRHYDGSGVTIGLADDGMIGPHIDFTGRVTQHLTGLGGTHGDMTSGICVGAGNLTQKIRGMGTGAYLHVFDISTYPQIIDAVNNYNNYGIVITSTSYAQVCNDYDADSQLGDQLIHSNSPFEFCFSAGNEGTTDCNYGAGNLWGNITGGYKLGKNVLACGNLNNKDVLETSSSRGPAIDGRIKPDICSNGIDQRSTDEGNTYQIGGGTSAACPGVAGCLSQLYQAYKELTGEPNPPSGLIKACVLNSAEDLGNVGPDFKHGWGRINAFRAVTTLEDHRYSSDSIGQGQTKTSSITVPVGVKQLRIMLYWHDVEGSPTTSKALVNDLNMQVTDPSSAVFNPWVLDPTPNVIALNTPAARGIDSLNNVEQVTIDNPASGTFTVSVNGNQIPLGYQEYFIVYEYRTDDIFVTFPNGGEGLVPADIELIRWDAFDTAGTFDVDYSTDNGSTWNSIVTGVPGTDRFYSWNVPNVVSDETLIKVSRNGFSDVNDTFFTIIQSPANLHVTFACPDSIGLAWNAVTNATGYDVSMLGSKYMDYIGTTTATNFTVTGTNPADDFWFSVKALGPHGGKGARADAIKQNGILNCLLSIDGSITNVLHPAAGLMTDCQNMTNIPVTIEIQNTGVTSINNFNVNYSLNGAAAITELFSGTIIPGASSNFTFVQGITFSGIGNNNLKIWLSIAGDQDNYNDTSSTAIDVIHGSAAPLSVIETFDTFTNCSTVGDCEQTSCPLGNAWINAQNTVIDDIDWRVNQGSTPSTTTGPDVDHTTGGATGKYIYLEASTCDQKQAILLSPCFNLNGITTPLLTFWYHMFGANMGELHVDIIGESQVYNDILPARIGNQGNFWLKDSAMLNQFSGQTIVVRFRGITGTGYASDMALDDIEVLDNSTGINEHSMSDNFIIYPNPGTGIFNFNMKNSSVKMTTITVRDILGKIVCEKTIADGTANREGIIDLSKEVNGVYTVTFGSEKYSQQIKLVKMK